MKKFIIAIFAIGAVSFASCKKDYTCECKKGDATFPLVIESAKKSAAAAICEGKGYDQVIDSEGKIKEKLDCKLK